METQAGILRSLAKGSHFTFSLFLCLLYVCTSRDDSVRVLSIAESKLVVHPISSNQGSDSVSTQYKVGYHDTSGDVQHFPHF